MIKFTLLQKLLATTASNSNFSTSFKSLNARFMKKLLLSLFVLLSINSFATTYFWVGGNATTFSSPRLVSTSTNWYTKLDGSAGGSNRTSLSTSDTLIFDGSNVGGSTPTLGTTIYVTWTTQTIGGLIVRNNNLNVIFTNISSASLTLGAASGAVSPFTVATGCTFDFGAGTTLALTTGATINPTINGTVKCGAGGGTTPCVPLDIDWTQNSATGTFVYNQPNPSGNQRITPGTYYNLDGDGGTGFQKNFGNANGQTFIIKGNLYYSALTNASPTQITVIKFQGNNQVIPPGTYYSISVEGTGVTTVGTTNSLGNTINTLTTNAAGGLTIKSGSILDLGDYTLAGTTITNNGELRVSSATALPTPATLPWGGTVTYNGTGTQTVPATSFTSLKIAGTRSDSIRFTGTWKNTAKSITNISSASGLIGLASGTTISGTNIGTSNSNTISSITRGASVRGYYKSGQSTIGVFGNTNNSPTNINLAVGMTVSGSGLPVDDTIVSFATAPGQTTATWSANQDSIWVASATGIQVGMYVLYSANYGVPTGAIVTAVSGNKISITPKTLIAGANQAVSFSALITTSKTATADGTSATVTCSPLIILTNFTTGTGTASNLASPTTLTLSSGTINLAGDYTDSHSGSFTTKTNTTDTLNLNGTGVQTITQSSSDAIALNNLTNSNTNAVVSAGSNLSIATAFINKANTIFDVLTNQISGAYTPTNSGTVRATGSTPFATSKAWGGTVTVYGANATQVPVATSYTNFTDSTTNSTLTATANVVVNGALKVVDGDTLNLSTFTLSGTGFSSVSNGSNTGVIKTSATTSALPAGITWASKVNYANGSSSQRIIGGSYSNLDFTGATTPTYGSTSSDSVRISKVFTPGSVTSAAAGTIVFNGTSIQKVPAFTYNNLVFNNASGDSIKGTVNVAGRLGLLAGKVYTDGVTNKLTMTNPTSTIISPLITYGSSNYLSTTFNNYIDGPLTRTISPSLTSSNNSLVIYDFPVGKGNKYLPIGITTPLTGTGTITLTAKSDSVGFGGISTLDDGSVADTTVYWSLTPTGNFTGASVSLSKTGGVSPSNRIEVSDTLGARYTNIGGTISSGALGASSNIGTKSAYYFVISQGSGFGFSGVTPTSPTYSGQLDGSFYIGQTVNVKGTGFSPSTTVKIGGVSASKTFNSSTSISAVVPNGITSGTIIVDSIGDGTSTKTATGVLLGSISAKDTTWNTTAAWLGGAVPASGTGVTLVHNITTNGNDTVGGLLIGSAGKLTFGASTDSITATSVNNNGSVVMTNGGFLILTGATALTNNTATFTAGTGTVVFNNLGGTSTVTGTISSFNNITFNDTLNLASSYSVTGTVRLDSGASFSPTLPTYGSASTLLYKYGATVGAEFGNGTTAGVGIPQNVTIDAGSGKTVTMPTSSRNVVGNLTITSGTLALSTTSGADLNLYGNFANNGGSITTNNRIVSFVGSTNATLGGSGTTTFDSLTINKTALANTVTLTNDITLNQSLNLTKGTLADGGYTISVGCNLSGVARSGAHTTTGSGRIKMVGSKKPIIFAGLLSLGSLEIATDSVFTFRGSSTTNDTLSIANTLYTTSGVLDLATYTILLSNGSTGNGRLGVENVAVGTTAIQKNKTWGGTVIFGFNQTSGNNRSIGGTYNNINFDNGRSNSVNFGSTTGATDTFYISGTMSMVSLNNTGYNNTTFIYNGSSQQSVLPCAYYNLVSTNAAGALIPSRNINIAGSFTGVNFTRNAISNDTLTFNGTSAQTVPVFPYRVLRISNTNATATAAGNLTVDSFFNITGATSTLDMGTYTLSGTQKTNSVTGTLKTANTSTTPLPTSAITWATGSVAYFNATSATQYLQPGSYSGITIDGGSTLTQTGNVTFTRNLTFVNGKLSIGSNTLTVNGGKVVGSSSTNTIIGSLASNILTSSGAASFGTLYFDQTTPGVTNNLNQFQLSRSGGVQSINIVDSGSGYVSNVINFPSTTATGTASLTADSVTSINITNAGNAYYGTTAPTITIGTQWAARTSYSLNQQLFSNNNLYTVTTAGFSSSTAPTDVTGSVFSDSLGQLQLKYVGKRAIATATISNGSVSAVTISSKGSGYTTAPTVSFSGGTVTSATATATLSSGKVIGATVTFNGLNYGSAPAITVGNAWRSDTTASALLQSSVPQVYYGSNLYTVTGSGCYGTVPPTHTSGAVQGSGCVTPATYTYAGRPATAVANYSIGYVTLGNNLSIGGSTASVLTISSGSIFNVGNNTLTLNDGRNPINRTNGGIAIDTGGSLIFGHPNVSIDSAFTINSSLFYDTTTSALTVKSPTFKNLTISKGRVLNWGTQTPTLRGTLTLNGATDTLNMGTTDLLGANLIVAGSGVLATQSTSTAPYPSGKTWATVLLNKSSGAQKIPSGTYTNLIATNTSGGDTATGNLSVSNQLNIGGAAATTFNMSTFTLNGLTTSSTLGGSGVLKTANTSSAPLPSSLTWPAGYGVEYNAATGGQTVANGTYDSLIVSNTSGINTANGNLSVNELTLNTSSVLSMASNVLSGSLSRISGTGTLQTANTSLTPIPTGKTWTGTVQYNNPTGGQTIVTTGTTYTNLANSNTSNSNSVAGTLNVTSKLTLDTSSVLDLGTNLLTGVSTTGGSRGTLRTANTSGTPIPSTKTWLGVVDYYAPTGGQTIVTGTYYGLKLSNTSGTDTTTGTITIDSVMEVTSANASLDLKARAIARANTPSGTTFTTCTGAGTIYIGTNGANSPSIPYNITWNPSVVYNSGANNRIVPGNYNNIDVDNGIKGGTIYFGIPGKGLTIDSSTFRVSGVFKTTSNNFTPNTSRFFFTGTNQRIPAMNFNELFIAGSGTDTIVQINGNSVRTNLTVADTLTLNNKLTIDSASLILNGVAIAGTPTNLLSTSLSSLSFGGSASGVFIPSSVTSLKSLTIGNNNGVAMNANDTLSGTLVFSANGGKPSILNTNGYTVFSNATGAISSASQANGWVNGKLQRYFATGTNVGRAFYVGDSTYYSPVTITLGNVSAAGSLVVKANNALQSNVTYPPLVSGKVINRYWNVSQPTANGVTYNNDYSASLNWRTPDNYASYDRTSVGVAVDTIGGFSVPSYTTPTTDSTITATSIKYLGDIVVGQLEACPSVANVSISYAGANLCKSVSTPQSVSLTNTSRTSTGVFSSSTGLTIDATTGDIIPSSSTIGQQTPDTVAYTLNGVNGCLTYSVKIPVSIIRVAPIVGLTNVYYGNTISLTDATPSGTWSSSSPSIATINATSGVVTGVSAGNSTITYTATIGSCTTSATYTVNVYGLNTWTGAKTTQWNYAANWSGNRVPVPSDDVLVPAGTLYAPTVPASYTTSIHNLSVAYNATLTDLGTLNVSGSLVTNGIVKGAGVVVLNGTTNQSLSGVGTTQNLTLNNTAGATISTTTKFNVNGVLTVATGTLTTNNNLTLKSTSITSSAVVAPVTGTITGGVIVERFIPQGKLGYRDLGASVANAGTVYKNWQESGSYTNGYGTFITGKKSTQNGQNQVDAATGFDVSQSGAASMFTYTNSAWSAITGTKSTTLNPYQGYRVYVRGNRAYSLFATLTAMNTSATLRDSGNLITGTVTYSPSGVSNGVLNSSYALNATDSSFTLLANPYVAPINWDNLTKTGLSKTYWYLDPTIGNGGSYTTWNTIAGTSNNPSAKVNKFIQAGQGFFVQTDKTNGATPGLVITESNKSTGDSAKTAIFGAAGNGVGRIAISLWKQTGTEAINYDGAVAVFSSKFSNGIGNEDSKKLMNGTDNLSIVEGGTALSINGRANAKAGDVLPIQLSELTAGTNYSIKIDVSEFDTEDVQAYLQDKVQGTTTAIDATNNAINFTPTSVDAASYKNRFSVVFGKKTSTTPIVSNTASKGSVTVYPNPVTGGTMHLSFQEVAKGNYATTLYNSAGQLVTTKKINHTGINGIHTIELGKAVSKGTYTLQVKGEGGNYQVNVMAE